MKFNGPKVKLSRRLGIALTPRATRAMQQGRKKWDGRGDRRLSDYGIQLLEKQRLRFQYNVSETQMRRYFQKAAQMKGKTGNNLLLLLESRIDAFVLRTGFVPTIFAARQVVGHGHFNLNGVRVRTASLRLRPGDRVDIRPKSRGKQMFDMDWPAYTPPPYIERDHENGSSVLLRQPEREEIPVICEEHHVVELYSR